MPAPGLGAGDAFAPDGRTLAVGTREEIARRSTSSTSGSGGSAGSARGRARSARTVHQPLVRVLAGRPAARGRPRQLALRELRARGQRFILFDGRTGRRLSRRLPVPARPDGGPRPVRPRRRADHLGDAGRDAGVGRPSGRIVRRFPIGGGPSFHPTGALALALNSWLRGRPERRRRPARPAHRPRAALQGRSADRMDLQPRFTPRRQRIVGPSWGGVHIWDIASGEVVDTYAAQGGPPATPTP